MEVQGGGGGGAGAVLGHERRRGWSNPPRRARSGRHRERTWVKGKASRTIERKKAAYLPRAAHDRLYSRTRMSRCDAIRVGPLWESFVSFQEWDQK